VADDDARIPLTEEEALVVFELLSRWQEAKESTPMTIELADRGEWWAMNNLLCALEPIVDPFGSDYGDRLAAAKLAVAPADDA
jgi:hypothetical protein